MNTATAIKVPPLIRAARLISTECGAMHVDNMTGCIVHDKKVERALAAAGITPYGEGGEYEEVDGLHDDPILIRRKKGGPKINPVLLDSFTASMLVQVWDKINDDNRAKMPALIERLTVVGFIDKMWALTK